MTSAWIAFIDARVQPESVEPIWVTFAADIDVPPAGVCARCGTRGLLCKGGGMMWQMRCGRRAEPCWYSVVCFTEADAGRRWNRDQESIRAGGVR